MAAGKLIAQQGFAQVTGKAIAARARVDLASINYHFGGREKLYQALLVEAHHRLMSVQELADVVSSPQPAPERLRRLVTSMVARATGKDGWSVLVLAREVLSPTAHFAVLRPHIAEKFGIAHTLFTDLTGYGRDDPRLIMTALATAAPFATVILVRRSFADQLTPLDQVTPELLVDHVFRFVISGLEGVATDN